MVQDGFSNANMSAENDKQSNYPTPGPVINDITDMVSTLTESIQGIHLSNNHNTNLPKTNIRILASHRARRVRFYRDGDKLHRGIVYAISRERYGSLDALIKDLNRSLAGDNRSHHLPLGVRHIFALIRPCGTRYKNKDNPMIITNGTSFNTNNVVSTVNTTACEILDITQFADEDDCVCSSFDRFTPIEYAENVGIPRWCWSLAKHEPSVYYVPCMNNASGTNTSTSDVSAWNTTNNVAMNKNRITTTGCFTTSSSFSSSSRLSSTRNSTQALNKHTLLSATTTKTLPPDDSKCRQTVKKTEENNDLILISQLVDNMYDPISSAVMANDGSDQNANYSRSIESLDDRLSHSGASPAFSDKKSKNLKCDTTDNKSNVNNCHIYPIPISLAPSSISYNSSSISSCSSIISTSNQSSNHNQNVRQTVSNNSKNDKNKNLSVTKVLTIKSKVQDAGNANGSRAASFDQILDLPTTDSRQAGKSVKKLLSTTNLSSETCSIHDLSNELATRNIIKNNQHNLDDFTPDICDMIRTSNERLNVKNGDIEYLTVVVPNKTTPQSPLLHRRITKVLEPTVHSRSSFTYYPSTTTASKIITIIAHRTHKKHKFLLSCKTARSLEQVFKGISEMVRQDSGPVRKLYALGSGLEVKELGDLHVKGETTWVACGTERFNHEDFTKNLLSSAQKLHNPGATTNKDNSLTNTPKNLLNLTSLSKDDELKVNAVKKQKHTQSSCSMADNLCGTSNTLDRRTRDSRSARRSIAIPTIKQPIIDDSSTSKKSTAPSLESKLAIENSDLKHTPSTINLNKPNKPTSRRSENLNSAYSNKTLPLKSKPPKPIIPINITLDTPNSTNALSGSKNRDNKKVTNPKLEDSDLRIFPTPTHRPKSNGVLASAKNILNTYATLPKKRKETGNTTPKKPVDSVHSDQNNKKVYIETKMKTTKDLANKTELMIGENHKTKNESNGPCKPNSMSYKGGSHPIADTNGVDDKHLTMEDDAMGQALEPKNMEPGFICPKFINKKYSVGAIIGDGNFAIVRECRNRKSGYPFALKIIDKNKCQTSIERQMIANEVSILRRISHPNIVQLFEEYETQSKLYLVIELVKGGDLFDVIAREIKFDEFQSSLMIADLANAVHYLHYCLNVVHRDIKPENLLVYQCSNGRKVLKLADFGLAICVTEPLFTVCGTPAYVAPEILAETGYGLEIDIWAMGVILYILLCGFPPFDSGSGNQDDLFDMILTAEVNFPQPFWNEISISAKDLIMRMLQIDPRLRYNAVDVLNHHWFQESLYGQFMEENEPNDVPIDDPSQSMHLNQNYHHQSYYPNQIAPSSDLNNLHSENTYDNLYAKSLNNHHISDNNYRINGYHEYVEMENQYNVKNGRSTLHHTSSLNNVCSYATNKIYNMTSPSDHDNSYTNKNECNNKENVIGNLNYPSSNSNKKSLNVLHLANIAAIDTESTIDANNHSSGHYGMFEASGKDDIPQPLHNYNGSAEKNNGTANMYNVLNGTRSSLSPKVLVKRQQHQQDERKKGLKNDFADTLTFSNMHEGPVYPSNYTIPISNNSTSCTNLDFSNVNARADTTKSKPLLNGNYYGEQSANYAII